MPKPAQTYEEWLSTATITSPTLQVGPSWSNHSRSYWTMLGIPVWEDNVFPHNWFKRQKAWTGVDLQMEKTPENLRFVQSHGGDLAEYPYSEGKYYPEFTMSDEDYDTKELDAHMRRAFSFIQHYKENRNAETMD